MKNKKCRLKSCGIEFTPRSITHDFHSSKCKNEFWLEAAHLGEREMERKGKHYVKLEGSKILQRIAKFLSDGKPHSTLEILMNCQVCAVQRSDLIWNGFDIDRFVVDGYHYYVMKGGFDNLKRIKS